MTDRSVAEVWLGQSRAIVAGLSPGPGTWVLDGDVMALDATTADEDLGGHVMAMLGRRATTVDVPLNKPLFAAAGVRSYRQLYREYVVVSVDQEDVELRLDPWVPQGRGLGCPNPDRHQLLTLPAADDAVGRLVRDVARHSRRLVET